MQMQYGLFVIVDTNPREWYNNFIKDACISSEVSFADMMNYVIE